MQITELKNTIAAAVDRLAPELIELSHAVHADPELGMREFHAAARQVELLKRHGFTVETPFCGMATAYRAVKGTLGEGPQIAFTAEYDALDGMGHACGHNVICASSVGAALALAEALDGEKAAVILFGSPAEETESGKVMMVEQGAFEHVDCVMMMHPSPNRNLVGSGGTACTDCVVEFFGKAAHSSQPAKGINALTAAIDLFGMINARMHIWPTRSKINGIITDGGTASNIIPAHAACRFTIRAARMGQVMTMLADIERMAGAAAAAVGATMKITHVAVTAERYSNRVLDEAFAANMAALGETCEWTVPEEENGSSDIGNVSMHTPTIQPCLSIEAGVDTGHTPEMRAAAVSPRGDQVVLLAAKGLAMTGADVFASSEFRAAMCRDYETTALPNKC